MSGFNLMIRQDEVDAEAAEVLVDGTVDGQPYRFLLDTGAARTGLGLDDYTAGFEPVDQNSSSGVFSRGSYDLIVVPEIAVGPIVKTNFTVTRRPGNSPGSANLIGMDLLREFCCHFFFDENRVAVYPGGYPRPDRSLRNLFLDSRSHPYVDVSYGPVQAQAAWDTGAGITIADLNFVEKNPALFQEAGQSTGTDSTGTSMATPMFMMAASSIGDNLFPAHKVAGVDLGRVNASIERPMDLILGYSTLRMANWLFDFPGRKWAVTKMLAG